MNAAIEMSFHLKRGALVWCSLDEIKTLCPRCSSPTHSAKNCDAFSSTRGRFVIPKSLVDNYEKFKPAGFRQLVWNLGQKRQRSSSRLKFCSKSRSRSRRRNRNKSRNNNNNINANNSLPVPEGSASTTSPSNASSDAANGSSSTSQPKKVSYADSLNQDKGKGKASDGRTNLKPVKPTPFPAPSSVDAQTLKSISSLIHTAASQLNDLKREFSSLKARCDSFDARISKLESTAPVRHSAFSFSPISTPSIMGGSSSSSAFKSARLISPTTQPAVTDSLVIPPADDVVPDNTPVSAAELNQYEGRFITMERTLGSMMSVISSLSGGTITP